MDILFELCSKKQEFGFPNYRKKYREYKKECQKIEVELEEILEGRLVRMEMVEERMNEIEYILAECEEIVNWQLELETKFNAKSLLLAEKRQLPQITITGNINNGNIDKYGSLVIGSQLSNNTDFNQQNKQITFQSEEEIINNQEEYQHQIEITPK